MSSKAPKHIRERRKKAKAKKSNQQKKPQIPKEGWQATLSVIWTRVIVVSVVLTIAAALLAFIGYLPRFSVDFQSLTDPKDPLSPNFVLTNDGSVPLYNLEYAIHITKLLDANGRTFPHAGQTNIPDLFIMARSYPAWKKLSAGDKATITLDRMPAPEFQFAAPLREGNLEVIVNYKFVLPWHQQRRYRFVSREVGGQQTWVRQPRSD